MLLWHAMLTQLSFLITENLIGKCFRSISLSYIQELSLSRACCAVLRRVCCRLQQSMSVLDMADFYNDALSIEPDFNYKEDCRVLDSVS